MSDKESKSGIIFSRDILWGLFSLGRSKNKNNEKPKKKIIDKT